MPKMIGTVNGFSVSPAKFGRKAFTFDGTIKGLTNAALAAGAAAGDTVRANFGGGMTAYVISATPWDSRAGGFWAQRA
jgi:hypothetical protein